MAGKIVDILKYIIGVDTKGLQTGAKQADRTVQSMSNNIKKALGAVSAAFIAAFGIHQMRKLAESVGDFAFKVTLVAARTEVLDVVLKRVGMTAGYSFGYLKQLEKQVASLGITTQVSRLILIRLMQTNLDLSYATKIATAAQNLAIIAGQNTAQTAETLTRAIAAQRPILLKQYGIMTNLNDIYANQAKLLKKSVTDLTEMERRQAFINEIMKQAARVQGIYTDAMEKAGKQYTSIPRYAEEAANAIGTIFLPTFGQMVKDVTQGFKDIKVAAEDETAVKRWQENILLLYQPLRLVFVGTREAVDLAADAVRRFKFALLDLPLGLAKKIAGVNEEIKKTVAEGFVGPLPLPGGKDSIKQIEQFSDAILKTRLWLLDKQRQYDKINEVEYLASLRRMLADTRYTEEQRVLLKRLYLEQLLQMEKTYADSKKAIEQAGLDFIEESDEKIAAGMEELNEQLTEQLDEAAEKRIEQLEEQLAFELSVYQAVGNAAARTFSDIFTSGKSLNDALEDGWKSFMDSVVNILANMLAKFIYTSLAELARHTATEKAKTAVTAAEAAKRAALTVGGPYALPLLFFQKGGLVGMQGGGLVRGLQTTRDNILAALSAGEFVIPRPAVKQIGVPALEHMRRTGSVPRGGGPIHLTIGDVTIGGTGTPRDYFLFEEFKDAMVELIEEKIKSRDLKL